MQLQGCFSASLQRKCTNPEWGNPSRSSSLHQQVSILRSIVAWWNQKNPNEELKQSTRISIRGGDRAHSWNTWDGKWRDGTRTLQNKTGSRLKAVPLNQKCQWWFDTEIVDTQQKVEKPGKWRQKSDQTMTTGAGDAIKWERDPKPILAMTSTILKRSLWNCYIIKTYWDVFVCWSNNSLLKRFWERVKYDKVRSAFILVGVCSLLTSFTYTLPGAG